MDDFLNMLNDKEIKKMARELESLSEKVERTGGLMKDALDMSGSAQALENYAKILENDVNKSFDKIFGKQRKSLSMEQQRLELIKAIAKANRDGDKAQQESLKTLMMNLERVKQTKEKMPSSIQKAHGALSLMSGIVPTGGVSRALNLGQGASQLMGGGMSMAKMGAIGGGLAIAGYGASRLMGGYQTYKQQAGDVLTGYGRLGQKGMSQLDLGGSTQGFSSVERAKTAIALSEGTRSGIGMVDAGRAVARNMNQAERQARTYGIGIQQTGGMISQVEQMSGRGGALTERMMATAVMSGVNRARLSSFMEKSLHLSEQVYQATGREESGGLNALLAQVVKNAQDKTYAEKYTAQTVGQIGEGIKSVGMGGGDLATQGFLSRAFTVKKEDLEKGGRYEDSDYKEGQQLSRYDFMKRAQAGVGGGNIRAVMSQAGKEFGNNQQSDVAMSQMFGINFKQMSSLREGLSGGTIKDDEVEEFIGKSKEETFMKTAEGRFFKSIADSTSQQAEMGVKMLPLATKMIEIQTHIDSGLYAVLDFLNIESDYEIEKRMATTQDKESGTIGAEMAYKAEYGDIKERKLAKSMKALEYGGPDDEFVAGSKDLANVKGYGSNIATKLTELRKKREGISKEEIYGREGLTIGGDTSKVDKEISVLEGKLKTFGDMLSHQKESGQSSGEMKLMIKAMQDAIKDGLGEYVKRTSGTENFTDVKNMMKDVTKNQMITTEMIKTSNNNTNLGMNK